MNHKTPSQQKYFDDLYELYHFNPFHDKMGRFASSSHGYVGRGGTLTAKGLRRINASDDDSSGDEEGGKKKKKGGDKIRVDSSGRVNPEDQDKAISKIEKQISKDYSNKSKMLNDSSRLINDIGRFRERNRNRTAKAKAAAEDISNMSNDELKKYIDDRTERMRLEQRYREIKEADYNRGRAKLDDMLETTGTVLALAATAATIAATIHTLKS